jgi:hypothetical protein
MEYMRDNPPPTHTVNVSAPVFVPGGMVMPHPPPFVPPSSQENSDRETEYTDDGNADESGEAETHHDEDGGEFHGDATETVTIEIGDHGGKLAAVDGHFKGDIMSLCLGI